MLRRGKVRDVYDIGEDLLLIVATDRISAFDTILEPGIPGKGIILTQMSNFWFERFSDTWVNHLVETDFEQFPPELRRFPELRDRSVIAKKCDVIPVECVARGYLIGSGWKDYQAEGTVCGIELPKGLRMADALPEPIFTPATKAETGHDENIDFETVANLVGEETATTLRDMTLSLYSRASKLALERGIIIADTKIEVGLLDGRLVWIDEALTPDSSRFWPLESYRPGVSPPSFDKQYVRDYLETTGWDKVSPAPPLPEDVVAGTAARYREAWERLTKRLEV
ncbi:MAG: phosphoribosylaminoimidazolesuccinocarboxamide synthase [Acidobacteria bacterium]|nr:phosphoribosylaminoimidazolesuccinocarboxamide synthase [Acidobacteriota bacterium]